MLNPERIVLIGWLLWDWFTDLKVEFIIKHYCTTVKFFNVYWLDNPLFSTNKKQPTLDFGYKTFLRKYLNQVQLQTYADVLDDVFAAEAFDDVLAVAFDDVVDAIAQLQFHSLHFQVRLRQSQRTKTLKTVRLGVSCWSARESST